MLKQLPDGRYQREARDPPPEILRGHPDIMRRAIDSLNTQHVYRSGVMSFSRGDVDVAAFNAGDPGLRATLGKLIEQFEALMFAGIPVAMRPPCFWTTHTHTGRLELNFLTPRAVQSGKGAKQTRTGASDRPIRAYNPHPPGKASRAMYDAFRRIWNAREGWADPEDPAPPSAAGRRWRGQRLLRLPPCQRARARRFMPWSRIGSGPGRWQTGMNCSAPSGRRAIRSSVRGRDISRSSRRGTPNPDPRLPHLPKAIRLKGALYGTGFTDRAQALDGLAPVDARPAPSPEAATDLCDPEADLALLRALRARKREVNHSRYGGPGWEPAPFVHSPAATALDQSRSYGASDLAEIAPASPAPLSHASRVKAQIWESLYQTALPPDLVDRISFVDGKAREVRFRDGSVVKDHGNRISGRGDSATLARIMALEARAKGWSRILLTGGDAFLRASAREALAQGIIPFGRTPEAEAVIAEEWARIGGPERRKPAAPRPVSRSAPAPRDEPRRRSRAAPSPKGAPAPDAGPPSLPAPPPEPGTKTPPPPEPPRDTPGPGI